MIMFGKPEKIWVGILLAGIFIIVVGGVLASMYTSGA